MPQITAQDVILEVLRNADGQWTGKTRLYKAFYFAHLYYAKQSPGMLTDRPIARMPEGPGIDKGDALLADMVSSGLLHVEQIHEGPYPEVRFHLTDKGQNSGAVDSIAREAIKEAIAFCSGKTAHELSEFTHEHSRSWIGGKNGDLLNVNLDIIPEEEYCQREADLEQLNAIVAGAYSGE